MGGLLAALERAVAERGAHPFILHGERRVTYAEFDRLAADVKLWLRAQVFGSKSAGDETPAGRQIAR